MTTTALLLIILATSIIHPLVKAKSCLISTKKIKKKINRTKNMQEKIILKHKKQTRQETAQTSQSLRNLPSQLQLKSRKKTIKMFMSINKIIPILPIIQSSREQG